MSVGLAACAACASVGLSSVPAGATILFARQTLVPRSVQEFAWQMIKTRCNFGALEREQRSFWAYETRARMLDGGVVYSISVLSELTWRKAEPPAVIRMTVVDDDGGLRLAALESSFVACDLLGGYDESDPSPGLLAVPP